MISNALNHKKLQFKDYTTNSPNHEKYKDENNTNLSAKGGKRSVMIEQKYKLVYRAFNHKT